MLGQADPFKIYFGDLATKVSEDISKSILSARVSYSTKMVTEITLEIFDSGFKFGANNYFNIGRDVLFVTKSIRSVTPLNDMTINVGFRALKMEVADITVSQSQGVNPIWQVKCRTKAIQQMKRDKKSGSFPNTNGTEFVKQAARKYGLDFVGEVTTKSKNITKASGTQQADSLWSVIQNLASQAQFECFEVDGVLYFASMKWLMHKWGSHSMTFDRKIKDTTTGRTKTTKVLHRFVPLVPGSTGQDFETMSIPEMHKGDNDPLEANGSANIARASGVVLRPGMTVFVGGIPTFVGYYLITAVDYEELSPDPVSITFATPERDPKVKITGLQVGAMYPQTGDPAGPDVLMPYLLGRSGKLVTETGPPWSIPGLGPKS